VLKSDEEVERLLNHKNNGLNKVEVKIIGSGNHGHQKVEGDHKNNGNQLRNKEDQANVGVLAELIGGKVTSELLGMHPAVISKYRNGKNASNIPNGELKSRLDTKLENINEKVVDKVDQLLDIFAADKMSELKASEIPTSAEKLISMFDKIKRRNDESGVGFVKPQVLLYAPKQINITELITKEVEG
jgi:hypothetical protein